MMLGSTPKANVASNCRFVSSGPGMPNTKTAPASTNSSSPVKTSPNRANRLRPSSVRSVRKANANCNTSPIAIVRHRMRLRCELMSQAIPIMTNSPPKLMSLSIRRRIPRRNRDRHRSRRNTKIATAFARPNASKSGR